MRASGRAPSALRRVSIEPGFARHAEGSCLIRMGATEVLCAASVEPRVPPFLRNSGQGWVTGEYGMLPRATHTRGDREAARGKQSGRTQEIQRLIGRSLRAVVDRAALGEMTVTLDCDVLNADGGTRCASVTGAWVALSLALRHLLRMNVIKTLPLVGQVAAVSCGLVGGAAVLDLDYDEDSGAQADANFVLTDAGGIVEIQGTAEKIAIHRAAIHRADGAGAGRLWRAVRDAERGAGGGLAVTRRLARGERLVLATHNPGKLREITELLAPFGIETVSAAALHLPEPPETEPDFGGNARLKALAAARAANGPALADDSGLCVTALGGAPGIFSARWAGLPRDFAAAMARVQRELGDAEDRSAQFISVLCLAWPDGEAFVCEGRVDGELVWPPEGENGFGYDPMFRPEGDRRTYGQMLPAEKHATNHRARAMRLFVAACLPPQTDPPRA